MKDQQEQYIDQLIDSLNEVRNKLELATSNIALLQQKLNQTDFIANEKAQLEVQLASAKQNLALMDGDRQRLNELSQQRQREVEILRNENQKLLQRIQQQMSTNVVINEQKLEIEQWKSKVARLEALHADFKKEEQVKVKCLND